MLGWQESTLKIHILELYDEFDNLCYSFIIQGCDEAFVTALPQFQIQGCDKVHCGNLVTMLIQSCDNLATTLLQPCHSFKIQGCAKVVTGCIVATL